MEYKLVQSVGSPHELEGLVNEELNNGWQLYGDLQVTAITSQRDGESILAALYVQVVTKG